MSGQDQPSPESCSQLLAVATVQHRELLCCDIPCAGCGQRLPLALLAFTAECWMVALCTRCIGEQTYLRAIATMMHAPRRSSCHDTAADGPIATPGDPTIPLTHPTGEAAYSG